jgi:plasmid stabilization system protein ParE
MSLQIVEWPQARKDFWNLVSRLALQSVSVAERFMDAVEESQKFLADFPISGSLIESDAVVLTGIRVSQVKGFRNFLIVFRTREDRIEILHYTHASRDLNALLQDL